MNLHLRLVTVILIFVFTLNVSFAQQKNLEQAYLARDISRVEHTVLKGYQLLAPEKLPQQFQHLSGQTIKCGTSILRDVQTNLREMNDTDQQFFSQYLSRPNLPFSYISPEGLFKLHYTLSGFSAVPRYDTDQSGIPDFIEEAARSFENSYHIQIDTLGYKVPPSDFDVDGPEIDVYFQNIGDYGRTIYETEISSTPSNDFASYMVLDNDYAESSYFSKGLDGMRVTAAHELFHVIQLGYHFRDMDTGFLEMSSVWMEERVYDEINDYYQYLSTFLLSTNLPLAYSNGNQEYGSSIFLIFIEEAFSEDIIRKTWEFIPNMHSMNSLNSALMEINSSLPEAFVQFGIWNYFTENRTNELKFYEEAENYPKILINPLISFQNDTTIVDSSRYLTLKYYLLKPQTSGFYVAKQNHPELEIWQTGIIAESNLGYNINSFSGSTTGQLGLIQGLSDVIMVSANGAIPEELGERLTQLEEFTFSYAIERQQLGESKDVFPNPYSPNLHSNFSVRLNIPNSSLLDAFIVSGNGNSIAKISLGRYMKGDVVVQIPWNGQDDQGEDIASGIYICILSGDDFNIPVKFALVR